MTDYAAAPAQPILQGLVTLTETGINFFGIGVVQTGPFAPQRVGVGDYILTLDRGLPGDVAIDPLFARTQITPRPLVVGTASPVLTKAVNYIVNPLTPGVGCIQIEILFSDVGAALVDSPFEIIVRRGDAGVELVNANLIGPLFQNN